MIQMIKLMVTETETTHDVALTDVTVCHCRVPHPHVSRHHGAQQQPQVICPATSENLVLQADQSS